MRFSFSGRDNLIPDRLRKRNIDQTVSVDMPQFPLSQPELQPAEAMGSYGDLLPTAHHATNTALCSRD